MHRGSSTEAPANIFIFGGIPKFSKPQNNNKKQTDGEQAASEFFDNSKSPRPPFLLFAKGFLAVVSQIVFSDLSPIAK